MIADLLSEDAHQLFQHLVASGGRPVGEGPGTLSQHEPALRELIRRGLVWEAPGPAAHVYAVSPVTAMRRLLAQEQRNVLSVQRRIIERYAELEALERRCPAVGSGAAGVEVVGEAATAAELAYELIAAAREECRSMQLPPADRPWPQARHRALIAAGSLEDRAYREQVEAAAAGGAQYRVLSALPAPMVITETAALVHLRPHADSPALVVRGGALVDSLTLLFDSLWHRAASLTGPAPGPHDAPTPVQLQVLRLAATGLKDEAIARSLGRSVRWVRRHFELLEERLGATNRMTLGIAATRRGWL